MGVVHNKNTLQISKYQIERRLNQKRALVFPHFFDTVEVLDYERCLFGLVNNYNYGSDRFVKILQEQVFSFHTRTHNNKRP